MGIPLLIIASVTILCLKLKEHHRAISYSSCIITLYKDITFVILLLFFLIESFLDFISYSLFIVPFFFTPPMAYAIEGLLSEKINDYKANVATSVNEIEYYISSLLSSTKNLESNSSQLKNMLIENNSTINECYLISILNIHSKQCEVTDCICKIILEGKNTFNGPQSRKNWILFAKEQLNEFIQKFSKEPRLYITSACLEYYWLKNCFMSLYDLERARILKPSIPVTICVLYILREIEEAMINGEISIFNEIDENRNNLEAIRITRFMKLFNRFLNKLEDCTASYISFWNALLREAPDAALLNRLGNKIFDHMNAIHYLYEKIININLFNTNLLYIYGVFLRYVVFDEITSDRKSACRERVYVLV